MPALARPQKITLAEMRAAGVNRRVLASAANAPDLSVESDVIGMAFHSALIVRLRRRLMFRRHYVFRMLMRGLPCGRRRGRHQLHHDHHQAQRPHVGHFNCRFPADSLPRSLIMS